MKKLKKLPDTPSELITLALKDLREVERQKKTYAVNMCVYVGAYDPASTYSRCEVCLAGSVMVGTLKLKPKIDGTLSPDNLGTHRDPTRRKLYALDHFRAGSVDEGLRAMNRGSDLVDDYWAVTPYEDSPTHFKKDMRSLATFLRKQGL